MNEYYEYSFLFFMAQTKLRIFNFTSGSAVTMFLYDNVLTMFAMNFKFQYLSAKYTNFSLLGCR
jgi:hypothetical protein